MARVHVNVRLSEAGLAEVDRIATETGRSRSDVIRAALTVALGSGRRWLMRSLKEGL